MQIPTQPAATTDAQQLRRDIAPSQPTAAVAGVSEQAQKLDPRTALRWAQPVFQGDATRLMRDSAAASLAPAGAAAFPQLSALAKLLGPWMAKAESQIADGIPPVWPEPMESPQEEPSAPSPPRAAVQRAMDQLMGSLSKSDAFAASNLARIWWIAPESSAPNTSEKLQEARWIASLSPESDGAQQAARLLLTGQILWEGQLLPNLPMTIRRKDAWRGGGPKEGPLEKGAALEVQVDLPGLGALQILGQQWGDELQLQVALPEGNQTRLRARWTDLQARLQTLDVRGLQLREIIPESINPAREGHND